jgi:hypothetical protein
MRIVAAAVFAAIGLRAASAGDCDLVFEDAEPCDQVSYFLRLMQ